MNSIKNAIWIAACALFILSIEARAYRASDFHWLPPFLAMEEKPSLTFILDTSASMLERAYSDPFNARRGYFGYFDSRTYYCYNAESDTPHFFADNATGEWNGNFLNWATMLRIDVARKVLTGGKFDDQSGCYEAELLGHEDVFDFDDTTTRRDLDDLDTHMTPLHEAFAIKARDGDGFMLISGPDFETRYAVRVKNEGEDEGGLLQAVQNKARVALITYEEGEPKRHPSTGYADNIKEIKDAVNGLNPQGNAPLAKTLHEVYENLRQDSGLNSKAAALFSEQTAPCSRQRVILFSNECSDLIELANQGSNLRPQDGMQNLEFYAIDLADVPCPLLPDNFFTANSWEELAKTITHVQPLDTPGVVSGTAAAVSTQTRSGEGVAYQAIFFPPGGTNQTAPPWSGDVHAYLVDAQGNLREANTSAQGKEKSAGRVIEFTGERIYVHADADDNGLIDNEERNATALDGLDDIEFLWSASTWLNKLSNEEAITQRSSYASDDKNRYIITFVDIDRDMVVDSGEIQHFVLPAKPAETTPNSPEHFYNYLTLYESGSGTLGFDRSDPTQNAIHKLREDNPSGFANLQATLAKRQVNFIRGAEVGNSTVMEAGNATNEKLVDKARSRTHQGTTWRLGDIVYSSPTAVGRPAENYHLIYNDTTYEKFLKKYLDRRQVVYVGVNDGMLHAFNGGFWKAGTHTLDKASAGRTEFELGQELWAYVPYNLLPHLKWLMLPEYGETLHVAYMDLTPRVFDARIFVDIDGVTSINETKYPGGWGTILVVGMRMGGAAMEVDIDKTDGNAFHKDIDRTVTSAYVIMDVTDPESPPNVLAEISMPSQGFTTCVPTVMPMSSPNADSLNANTWYLVFGSGPADAAGRADKTMLMRESSDQPGKLFVLNLSSLYVEKTVKTVDSTGLTSPKGEPFAFAEAESFTSDPVCVDLDIPSKTRTGKLSTDLVYFGTVAGDSASQAGKVYRLQTGNGPPEGWQTSTLVDVAEPVSAPPSVAVDETGSLWIYFGTGRLFNHDDHTQTTPMSFYGIREPETDGVRNWDRVFAQNLFDSSRITVTQGTCGEEEFSEDCVGIIHRDDSSNATQDWAWLTSAMDQTSGWKHAFSVAGERVLGQAAVLGGSVVFTSFIPTQEICATGGTSRLWSLYYKTGTPYFWPSLEHTGGTFPAFIELGPGMAAAPTLHIGENPTITAIVQSTTSDLTTAPNNTPLPFKSGCLFWRKNTD